MVALNQLMRILLLPRIAMIKPRVNIMKIDIHTRYQLATNKEDEGLTYKEQTKRMLQLNNTTYNQWEKDHPILSFICRSLNIDVRKITGHFAMKEYHHTVGEINRYVSITLARQLRLDGYREANKTFTINVGYGRRLDIPVKVQSFKGNNYHLPLEVVTLVSSEHSLVMLTPYPCNNPCSDTSTRYAFEIPNIKINDRDNGAELMAAAYKESMNLDELAENYKYLVSTNIATDVFRANRLNNYNPSDSERARQSLQSINEQVIINTMMRELKDEKSILGGTDYQGTLIQELPEFLVALFKQYALDGHGDAMDMLKKRFGSEYAMQELKRIMQVVEEEENPTIKSIFKESITYLQRILKNNPEWERELNKF